MNKRGRRRAAAGAMAIVFLCFILFASFFTAAESDHDCSGDGCPICAVIHVCADGIRGVGTGASSGAAVIAAVFFAVLSVYLKTADIVRFTQVSFKVRMDA